MNLLWMALVLGTTGGLHCAAMCGPIVAVLPGKKWSAIVLYNTGRAVMYAALGIIVAFAGLPVKWLVGSQWFSILVGSLIIIIALYSIGFKTFWHKKNSSGTHIRGALKRVWNISPVWSPFLIGTLNALLPCGLLYVALISSAGMDHPLVSGLFMFIFALGTWPALFIVWLIGNQLKIKFTNSRKWIQFGFALVFGLLIITRGMNAGIPLISPEISIDKTSCAKLNCCNP